MLPAEPRVFLALGSTDLRKAIDGLRALVQERQARLIPLMEKLNEKIESKAGTAPPKSKLGKALIDAAKTLPRIMKAVDCPNLTLDNNDLENKVRPFALGRKNWLMARCSRPGDLVQPG